jgi:hypothetical protein
MDEIPTPSDEASQQQQIPQMNQHSTSILPDNQSDTQDSFDVDQWRDEFSEADNESS